MAHILLVDDEPLLLRYMERQLRKRGHRVLLAADGQAALEQYHKHHPDLILLDILLPDISGLDVLKHIRLEDSTTPIFLVTGFLDRYRPELLELEEKGVCFRVVEKPEHIQTLVTLISAVTQEAS